MFVQDNQKRPTLKVFVSYSRNDLHFASQIVAALEDRGHSVLLDQADIEGAENWKERLGDLIRRCDVVLFVLTSRSASSPVCNWEIEEAVRLDKKLIPAVPEKIENVEIPAPLAELNFIFFYQEPHLPGSGFYDGVKRLHRVLSTDLVWTRQRTIYQEAARKWIRTDKSPDFLLRGQALNEFREWRIQLPSSVKLADEVERFLAESERESDLVAERVKEERREKELLELEQMRLKREADAQKKLSLYRSRIGAAVSTVLTAAFFFVGLITSGVVSSVVSNEMYEQLRAQTIELENAYISGGLTRLNQSMLERAAAPWDNFVYQLEDPSGGKISGHFAKLPTFAKSINSTGNVVFEADVSAPDGRTQVVEIVGIITELPDASKFLVGVDSQGFKHALFAVQSTFIYSAFVVFALYALSLFYFLVIGRRPPRGVEDI